MSGQVVDQLRQELSVATSLGQLEQLVDAVQEAYNKSPDLLEELLRLLPEIFAKGDQCLCPLGIGECIKAESPGGWCL